MAVAMRAGAKAAACAAGSTVVDFVAMAEAGEKAWALQASATPKAAEAAAEASAEAVETAAAALMVTVAAAVVVVAGAREATAVAAVANREPHVTHSPPRVQVLQHSPADMPTFHPRRSNARMTCHCRQTPSLPGRSCTQRKPMRLDCTCCTKLHTACRLGQSSSAEED